MKFKQIFLSTMATLLILSGSIAAYAQSSSTSGTVKVIDGGVFDFRFCNSATFKVGGAGGTDPSVTSAEGAVTEGTVGICITDTKSHRGDFTLTMSASDFASITPGVVATIPVDNLYLRRVIQPRYASPIVSQPEAGNIYSVGATSEVGAVTNGSGNSANWGILDHSLSEPRVVVRGEAGVGISNTETGAYVRPGVYMNLVVPAGQQPATYRTQLTLTLTPDSP